VWLYKYIPKVWLYKYIPKVWLYKYIPKVWLYKYIPKDSAMSTLASKNFHNGIISFFIEYSLYQVPALTNTGCN